MTEKPRPCPHAPNHSDASAPLFRDRRSRCTCGSGPAVRRPDDSSGGGRAVRAAGDERDRVREHAAGDSASDWQIDGSGRPTIQGYATAMSVNQGDTV